MNHVAVFLRATALNRRSNSLLPSLVTDLFTIIGPTGSHSLYCAFGDAVIFGAASLHTHHGLGLL